MEDTLPIALSITAIGMTLLFLALGLFYGLLALLTAVVKDRSGAAQAVDDPPAVETTAAEGDVAGAARTRAAAIAVALARAEVEAGGRLARVSDQSEVGTAGNWWALHHGRRMAAPPSPWRGR